jgi:hypothetical protein
LTDSPLGSPLLLASLGLWVLGVIWIPSRALVRRLQSNPPPASNAAHVYRWFLTSAACAVAAFVIGSHELSRVDGPLRARIDAVAERDHDAPKATAKALRAADGLQTSLLLRTFAPRLFLPTTRAAWPHHPWVDVLESEVVNQGTGTHSRTRWDPPDQPSVPADCTYPGGNDCYITDHCFQAGEACNEVSGSLTWPYGMYVPPGGNTRDGYLRPYGVMYARLVHRTGESPGDSPEVVKKVFANVGHAEDHFGGRRITDVLQYWMYYRYDDWRANTALGQIVQEHESDWEAVTVGLSGGEPLFVAYSAHCGGQWLAWPRVPAVRNKDREEFILESLAAQYPDQADDVRSVIEAGRTEPTHPAVMVAEGSQGNYPATSDIRVPDWTSCPVGHTLGDVVAAAAAVRERVDVAVEVVPAEVFLAGVESLPMDFGGHWGLNSRQRLILPVGGLEIPLGGGKDTPGPPAPPQQGVWTDPFGTIFDSGDWHEGAEPG